MKLTEDEILFNEYLYKEAFPLIFESNTILRPLPNPLNVHRDGYTFFLQISRNHATKSSIRFPEVIVDFIGNTSVNAFADKYKGKYLIGINRGVQIILYDLFMRMLSHQEVFKEVGDSSKEKYEAIPHDYFTDVKELLKAMREGVPILSPKDNHRKRYADFLSGLAMDFIFHHELAHILNGHVDYLKHMGRPALIESYSSSALVSQNLFDLQTLERDADHCGLHAAFGFQVLIMERLEELKVLDSFPFYSDRYSLLSDLFFAAYNMLRLFGDGNYEDLSIGSKSHPEPRIRQLMMVSTIVSVAKRNGLDVEKVGASITKKVTESENAYCFISGNPLNREPFQEEYLGSNPLPDAIELNWKKNIREKLRQFAFKELTD